jgi:deazaflavin-dependent oxidoreductase (nitroreductase family)
MLRDMWNKHLAEVAAQKIILLTTWGRKTGKPHTVELWFALNRNKIYLSHEGEETDWMKNIRKNEQVSFEIEGRKFKGRAYSLKESAEAWTAKVALYEKYYVKASKEVIEDWFSLSTLFLIEPTTSN